MLGETFGVKVVGANFRVTLANNCTPLQTPHLERWRCVSPKCSTNSFTQNGSPNNMFLLFLAIFFCETFWVKVVGANFRVTLADIAHPYNPPPPPGALGMFLPRMFTHKFHPNCFTRNYASFIVDETVWVELFGWKLWVQTFG